MSKICRICWNTNNWKSPSGEAGRLESPGSYAADHGYGHEEWLFNFNWLLPDYKNPQKNVYHYGFLQPLSILRKNHQGEYYTVYLYTKSPENEYLVIAKVDQIYLPHDDELDWAYQQIVTNGWLNTMKQDLANINLDNTELGIPNPDWVINVRFRPEDVTTYFPRKLIADRFKLKWKRYMPYNCDDEFSFIDNTDPDLLPPTLPSDDEDPSRSEALRKRAAIEGTIYDPRHTKLQNPLYRWLCLQYGQQAVGYEKNFVDLSLHTDGKTTFYEIKIENSAKKCIRLALGQLLEYSHFPDQIRAEKLVVVGDMQPTLEDMSYLKNLRSLYSLPVFYSRWNWESGELEREV